MRGRAASRGMGAWVSSAYYGEGGRFVRHLRRVSFFCRLRRKKLGSGEWSLHMEVRAIRAQAQIFRSLARIIAIDGNQNKSFSGEK